MRRKEVKMSVNSVSTSNVSDVYGGYSSAAKVEKNDDKPKSEVGAVYEKSADDSKKATYSINKMSESERSALVQQLKDDQAARQQNLIDIVNSVINKQGKAYSQATGDDSIWKFLASGEFEVDAATKEQAMQDISEDGYWGIKQTSQRLFDYASALAGDDEEKMKSMQDAIEKGFKQATKAWGKDLPQISNDTLDATNKLFEDYFNSKKAQ